MTFRYQVLDKSKQLFQGELEAETMNAARLSLLGQGYDVLSVESVKQRYIKWTFGRVGVVSLKEKMLFVKHLSLMVKSGMVLDESLEALYEQSRGRMKTILRRLVEAVRKGNVLSDVLKLFPYTFNEFFVNMVKVGEQSGSLEKTLVDLSIKLKKDHDLKTKVRSAMMYPAIVLIALGGLGITLTVFILPKLLVFFKSLSVTIPLTTRIFISSAEFLQKYWFFASLTLIIVFVSAVIVNRLPKTKIVVHWLIYHMPLSHRFSQASNLANFCRSMNLMLRGGITIDESLDIMSRAMTSVLYQRRIMIAMAQVSKGGSFSDALEQFPHYFPPLITRMIHVGEISGNLDETFEYLAEFFEDEMDALSKDLSTILEPVLLLVIGLLVGFMAMAIISPIYQLTGGIAR